MDGEYQKTIRSSPRGDLRPPLRSGAQGYEEAAADAIVDRRYVLRREIARGGIGLVFEAEHVVTRARVAVKTLRRGALEHPDAHARMEREARALGALRHPMIVGIHDAGLCPNHGPYLSLELIEGRPLDGMLLSRHSLPVGQAVALLVQLCQALEAVHDAGYVHRDVKPANVLVSRTALGDQLELLDFGVAKILGEAETPSASKLTRSGELLGTVDYMSPEQLMGTAPVDVRTDVYAAGVLLYECLTGEVPFGGAPTSIIAAMVAGQRPRPIRDRRPEVPLALEAAVRGALEIPIERRFERPHAFAQACIEALGGSMPALDLLHLAGASPPAPKPPRAAPPPVPQAVAAPEPPIAAGPPPSPVQRRQFARAPYVAPVRVLSGPGKVNDGRTEDISEGGLLIVTDHECAGGAEVHVRMPLPASGRVVSVKGITRWVKSGRGQRAIGVEFVDLANDVRAEVKHYVALMNGGGRPAR